MNALPDLVIPTPADPAAEALALAADPVPANTLPDWLETGRTPKTPLDAVMFHPAAEVTAALAATGTADLPTLLEHLAAPTHHTTGAPA